MKEVGKEFYEGRKEGLKENYSGREEAKQKQVKEFGYEKIK